MGFKTFAADLNPHVAHQQTMGLPEIADLAPDDVWTEGAPMFAKVAGPAKLDARGDVPLAHELPLLVLPQGANQFWNAERAWRSVRVSAYIPLSCRPR